MTQTITPREDIYPVFENPAVTPKIAVVREFHASFMNEHGAKEDVLLLVEPNGHIRAVRPATKPENQMPDVPKVL